MAGRYFGIPFATTGDRITVPDATQPDGSVSFTQGFGFDYERPNTDPEYKPVPRDGTNGLFHDITEALGIAQLQGVSDWTVDAQPYPINALVRHTDKVWRSLVANNNVTPTEGASWADVGALATETQAGLIEIATTADTQAGTDDVRAITAKKLASVTATKADKTTSITAGTGLTGGGTLAGNRTLDVMYGTSAGTAAQGNDSRLFNSREWAAETISQAEAEAGTSTIRRAFTAQRVRQAIVAWASANWASANMLQTTGYSTASTMSQKAISDQLIGVGKTWTNVTAARAWNTWYTNTTGRTLPIAVIVKDPSRYNLGARLFINDALHSEVYTDISHIHTLCADIPNGSTYEVRRADNNDVIISWMEL